MNDKIVCADEACHETGVTKDSENLTQEAESLKTEAEFTETVVGYLRARKNLGLVLVLTLINMALTTFGSSLNFPFSAFVPDILVGLGKASNTSGLLFYWASAILMALFGMCWLFCMVRPWWMVCALILFVVDTVAMGWLSILCMDGNSNLDVSLLINGAFHIWVLTYLVKGVGTGFKLRKFLKEKEESETRMNQATEDSSDVQHSSPEEMDLRRISATAK